MCGIVGIFNHGAHGIPHSRDNIDAMLNEISHRGPDGKGHYIDGPIALGHARLSIIDLAGGAQPIHNEDKSVWVVFNGEIYNYIELRRALEARGHRFYTRSDTEVLVHLYEDLGNNFVAELVGQFAIALWDSKASKLLLVRDHAGIAPLFYTQIGGRFAFASEIKALLRVHGVDARLNAHGLDQLMTLWAPVSPNTVFENIYEVSPGHLLEIDMSGQVKAYAYWQWRYPAEGDYLAGSERQLAGELRELLIDATRLRLRSDVAVGAYLSGGLDSSVTAALIKKYSDVPLRTFSIGFEDAGLDETAYQQIMIKHLGAEHSHIRCSDADIAREFPSAIWHTESPLLRTAPVPMRMLSRLAREQGYKVVLTGEGADEALGGYDIFKENKIRQFWAKFPQSTRRASLLKRLYPYLDLNQGTGRAYLQAFFGIGLDNPQQPFFSHLPRWETTGKTKEFFSATFKERIKISATKALDGMMPNENSRWSAFNRGQFIEAKTLLSGYLLSSQGDRMLMASSVEGRFPFLDHRVIEFANRLPPRLKMKVLNEKYLLKAATQDLLPEAITARHKQPYRAPDAPAFFRGGTPGYVHELLSARSINEYGYFDAAKVKRLVDKVQRMSNPGYKDNMSFIAVLSTQIWHTLFVKKQQVV
ncbi:MAG: asparagine synthase (glutamine-hydrolyzing) [Pseudomonadota bacterium]